MSISFDSDRGRRQGELPNNKTQKGIFHPRIYLKHIFSFAELQEEGTFGLSYQSTLTRSTENAVLNKDNAINSAKIKIFATEGYVAHYTPSIANQAKLFKQITSKTPTELQYVERSVFIRKVNTQNFWTFELGTQECINTSAFIIKGFQQRDRQNSKNLNNDLFYRPAVTSAKCIIEVDKNPDSAKLLNYNDDEYSQGYGQIKETFRALTKDDILKPYVSEHDFISSNDGDDIGYNLYVFDIRYQKDLEDAQAIKVEFTISENILAGIYGYALVLTNKLVSISSDVQRHFDLI